jgi:hypothetical protein
LALPAADFEAYLKTRHLSLDEVAAEERTGRRIPHRPGASTFVQYRRELIPPENPILTKLPATNCHADFSAHDQIDAEGIGLGSASTQPERLPRPTPS